MEFIKDYINSSNGNNYIINNIITEGDMLGATLFDYYRELILKISVLVDFTDEDRDKYRYNAPMLCKDLYNLPEMAKLLMYMNNIDHPSEFTCTTPIYIIQPNSLHRVGELIKKFHSLTDINEEEPVEINVDPRVVHYREVIEYKDTINEEYYRLPSMKIIHVETKWRNATIHYDVKDRYKIITAGKFKVTDVYGVPVNPSMDGTFDPTGDTLSLTFVKEGVYLVEYTLETPEGNISIVGSITIRVPVIPSLLFGRMFFDEMNITCTTNIKDQDDMFKDGTLQLLDVNGDPLNPDITVPIKGTGLQVHIIKAPAPGDYFVKASYTTNIDALVLEAMSPIIKGVRENKKPVFVYDTTMATDNIFMHLYFNIDDIDRTFVDGILHLNDSKGKGIYTAILTDSSKQVDIKVPADGDYTFVVDINSTKGAVKEIMKINITTDIHANKIIKYVP